MKKIATDANTRSSIKSAGKKQFYSEARIKYFRPGTGLRVRVKESHHSTVKGSFTCTSCKKVCTILDIPAATTEASNSKFSLNLDETMNAWKILKKLPLYN